MYLKQKLKQEINVALPTRRFLSSWKFSSASDLTCTPEYSKVAKEMERRKKKSGNEEYMLRNIEQAGAYLAVSRSTVYRLINEGRLKRVYVKGAPRVTNESLARAAGELDG